jgi:8-oxo-dGTP pyrophosphatase MutT (NUDIX family)
MYDDSIQLPVLLILHFGDTNMWLLTNFGFFSVVQKPGDKSAGLLTIRSRVKGDLENLRKKYLPDMGEIEADAGTDYQYRAKASRESVANAVRQIVMELDYSNLKDSVAAEQGQERSNLYHEVWDVLYKLPQTKRKVAAPSILKSKPQNKRLSYGGVLFDESGRVLLRKPKHEFDGYAWTFAKGHIIEGKTPEETALREVLEETGYNAQIIGKVDGLFEGGTTIAEYFVMAPVGEQQPFDPAETAEIRWVPMKEAIPLIKMTRNSVGRKRDLAVLDAAQKILNSKQGSNE